LRFSVLQKKDRKAAVRFPNCSHLLFPLLEQIQLVLPDLVSPELIGRSLKLVGKIRDCLDRAGYGSLSVITVLDLLHHDKGLDFYGSA
jgi:hypothetical protein